MSNLSVNAIRFLGIDAINKANSGHPGVVMGAAPMAYSLFTKELRINPAQPNWINRDRFILSAGHGSMLLYALLQLSGFEDVSMDEVKNFRQWGSKTPGHPEFGHTAGVDATTGSLGQGISIAGGIAKALQIDKKSNRVFCIIGDGEINEGQCWEAFQFIAHHNLNNLTVFLDYNKQQLDGTLEEIIKPFSFEEKMKSFGFDVVTIKGDDIQKMYEILKEPRKNDEKPLFVVLDTLKGQGVEYIEKMENSHHLRLTDELKQEIEKAIKDLESEVE